VFCGKEEVGRQEAALVFAAATELDAIAFLVVFASSLVVSIGHLSFVLPPELFAQDKES
jgi:hypothetical protein